ncbi:MFS transporter [Phenylobacterium sp.]|uniref:MFS transporter n=1 Tax=Phenylobacterium sp. TaxID=1871053 RepID=UPI003BAC24EC
MNQGASGSSRLGLPTILGFSLSNLPLGALAVAVAVYLPPYFASHLGVSLTVVGSAWAIVRLLDIGVDPVLGLVMDRTRTRIGRYRFWMIIGAPILMLATYALFQAPHGIGSLYLIGWLLIFYLGTSILGLGHSAWGANLSTEYHERSRLFGVVAALGVIGAVVVLLIPIGANALHRSTAEIVPDMGWFIFWLIPVSMAWMVFRTPERIAPETGHPQFRLRDYVSLLVKPDLLRLFLAQMALTLGPGWMSALYVFFFTDSRGFTPTQASALLLVYILAGIVGAPLTALIARRLSKHRTLMVTTTAYSLGLCMVLVVPKANVAAAIPVMFWCGFMAAGFDLMIRAMLADVGDEVRLEQGQERLSLIYALNSLAAKIASAFSIGLTFPLLARLGYKAAEGAVNTPSAIRSLEWAYIAGPIIFVMLGGACVVGWRLDADRHAQIRRDLDDRDAQYAEAPIIESVSTEPAIPILDGKAV